MTEIQNPQHYNAGKTKDEDGTAKYETIKLVEDWDLGFKMGNALKYVMRAGRKGVDYRKNDLEKALWYLERAAKVPEQTVVTNGGRVLDPYDAISDWEIDGYVSEAIYAIYAGMPDWAIKAITKEVRGVRYTEDHPSEEESSTAGSHTPKETESGDSSGEKEETRYDREDMLHADQIDQLLAKVHETTGLNVSHGYDPEPWVTFEYLWGAEKTERTITGRRMIDAARKAARVVKSSHQPNKRDSTW